jgi:hypothetical protein
LFLQIYTFLSGADGIRTHALRRANATRRIRDRLFTAGKRCKSVYFGGRRGIVGSPDPVDYRLGWCQDSATVREGSRGPSLNLPALVGLGPEAPDRRRANRGPRRRIYRHSRSGYVWRRPGFVASKPRRKPGDPRGNWRGRNPPVVRFSLVRNLAGRHARFHILVRCHNVEYSARLQRVAEGQSFCDPRSERSAISGLLFVLAESRSLNADG